MYKSHLTNSPMVVRSLEVNKDSFRPKEENEELFGSKVSYLSAISALMYLANCTRPDIAFSVNLLARYSSPQLKGIGMRLNIYCDTFVEQVTWAYIIQKNQNHN